MANVAERPVDRKRPEWVPSIESQWGTEDERHHDQAANGSDEPH